MIEFLTLAIIYQIKHFLADFPLQSGFMLKKFLPGWDFFFPLAAHCAVHAGMTLAIVLCVNPALWWLALVDFGIHFLMDRIKAGPKYLGRYKALSANEFVEATKSLGHYENSKNAELELYVKNEKLRRKRVLRSNKLYWLGLGTDQAVHHLTHYFIIWRLLI